MMRRTGYLKTAALLYGLAAPFTASAAVQPSHDYALKNLVPSALRIEVNGYRFACPAQEAQADCVYRKTRQSLKWMRMADDDCPVEYEAGNIRDIFMALMKKDSTDAELVDAHRHLADAHRDIKKICYVPPN